MTIAILIGIAVLLFVGGLLLILKGLKPQNEEGTDNIVPISDPQELQRIQEIYNGRPAAEAAESAAETAAQIEPAAPPSAPDPELIQAKERLEKEVQDLAEKLKTTEEDLQKKINELREEKDQLKQALERELSSKQKTPSLTPSPSNEKTAALEEKLNHAEASVMRLNGENTRLRRLVEEQKQMLGKFDKGFDALAQHTKTQKQQQSVQNEAMGEELERFKEEMRAQTQKDKALIDKLRQELEQTNKQKEQVEALNRELEQKQKEIQVQLKTEGKNEQAREDNVDLRQQLQKAEVRIQNIQENMEVMKLKYEQQLNDAQDEMYRLKNQNQTSGQKSGKMEIDPVALSKAQLEDSAKELTQLREQLQEAEQAREALAAENAQLLEKDRLMQFELTKNRAQTHGLTQICEELKKKVEMAMAAKEEK